MTVITVIATDGAKTWSEIGLSSPPPTAVVQYLLTNCLCPRSSQSQYLHQVTWSVRRTLYTGGRLRRWRNFPAAKSSGIIQIIENNGE